MDASRGTAYKPQLDTLRAFAVSAVMLEHFLPVQRIFPQNIFNLGILGLSGVLLFFVLSGYLITGILLRSRKQVFRKAILTFYIRRALRIFPIYYLTLILLGLLGIAPVGRLVYWHAVYLSNMLFVLHPEAAGITAHLWTLSVEEQFYLLWPLFMLLVPYKHLPRVIIWTIVVGICWKGLIITTLGNHLAGALPTVSCLEVLGAGAYLAFLEQDKRLSAHRRILIRSALIAGSIIMLLQMCSLIINPSSGFVFVFSYFGASLVFVWLIGGAAQGFTGRLGSVLEWKPLLYMGKISYGIYLYHNFMPATFRYVMHRAGVNELNDFTIFFASLALTLLTSALSWHLIEKPIGRFKDRFGYITG
jgi:peptidoglycan/LPS O-acetylase OafA/YrhL